MTTDKYGKIITVRFPPDMEQAFERLITQQGSTQSKIIRGSLLMAWADHFSKQLGYDRFNELMSNVLQNDTEEQ
jgi:hypothetical protein